MGRQKINLGHPNLFMRLSEIICKGAKLSEEEEEDDFEEDEDPWTDEED